MAKKLSYEQLIESIDEKLKILENSELSLEVSVKTYKECRELIKEAEKLLASSAGEIKKINETIDSYKMEDFNIE